MRKRQHLLFIGLGVFLRAFWPEVLNTVAELICPDDDYPWETFEGPPDDWALSDMAFRSVR